MRDRDLTLEEKIELGKELKEIMNGFETADQFITIEFKDNVVHLWQFHEIMAHFELETKRKGIGAVQTHYQPKKTKFIRTIKNWIQLCISNSLLRAKNHSYKGTILEYKPKKLNKVLDSETADEGYVFFRGTLLDSKVNTIGLPFSKICWNGDQCLTFNITKYVDDNNYDVEFDVELQAIFMLYDEDFDLSYQNDKMKYITAHLYSDGDKFKHLERIVIVLPKQINVSRKKVALEIVRHILLNFSQEDVEKATSHDDWKKFYDEKICEELRNCHDCRFYLSCEDWFKEIDYEVVKA